MADALASTTADDTARQARRSALLIGVGKYRHSELPNLRAAAYDVRELARVLRDPDVGAFDDVTCLVDGSAIEMRVAIERFFANRNRDDLLILHYSGHGLRDATSELYLAARDTDQALPDATGISAAFLNRRMTQSRSRRILVLVDACHSGILTSGLVPRGSVTAAAELNDALQGAGRVIIAATGPLDWAFEPQSGGRPGRRSGRLSVFTGAVVAGLDSGEADLDGDGQISADDLYQYVHDAVRRIAPKQVPALSTTDVAGRLFIARRRGHAEKPISISEDTDEVALGTGRASLAPLELKPSVRHLMWPLAYTAGFTALWAPWITIGELPTKNTVNFVGSMAAAFAIVTAVRVADLLTSRVRVDERGVSLGFLFARSQFTWDGISDIITVRTLFGRRIKVVGIRGGRTFLMPWPRGYPLLRHDKLDPQAGEIAARRPGSPPARNRSLRRNAHVWESTFYLLVPVLLLMAIQPWFRVAWPWSSEAISLPAPCATASTAQQMMLVGREPQSTPEASENLTGSRYQEASCTWRQAGAVDTTTAKDSSDAELKVTLKRYVDSSSWPDARGLADAAFIQSCSPSTDAVGEIGRDACIQVSPAQGASSTAHGLEWMVTVRALQANIDAEVTWTTSEPPGVAALHTVEDVARQALADTHF